MYILNGRGYNLKESYEKEKNILIVVKATDLNKIYNKSHALKDFNITINKGDIYGLIGVNGAGKSTFIKIIAGITEAQSGTVALFGDEKDLHIKRRRIGSVIETPSFFPGLSAKQNLEYFATVMGIKDKGLIRDVLVKVNLDPSSKKKFRNFSLGMKQRLGIALALLNAPEFIILDEPTNGLDPKGIIELRDIIRDLNAQGVTFLICSHILAELTQIATKYGIVHKGEFIKELTNEDLSDLCRDKISVIVDEENKPAIEGMLAKFGYDYKISNDSYEIILSDGINAFIERLVSEKVKISSLTQSKTSLEEVFFNAIGGAENA